MNLLVRLLALAALAPALALAVSAGPAGAAMPLESVLPESARAGLAGVPGGPVFGAGLVLSAAWIAFAITVRKPAGLLAAGATATLGFAMQPAGSVAWPLIPRIPPEPGLLVAPLAAAGVLLLLLLADQATSDAAHLARLGAAPAAVRRHRTLALAAAVVTASAVTGTAILATTWLTRLPDAGSALARLPTVTLLAAGLLALLAAALLVPKPARPAEATDHPPRDSDASAIR